MQSLNSCLWPGGVDSSNPPAAVSAGEKKEMDDRFMEITHLGGRKYMEMLMFCLSGGGNVVAVSNSNLGVNRRTGSLVFLYFKTEGSVT